jgi:hypothetical protein
MTSYDDLVELEPVCMQQAPKDQRLPDAGRLTSAGKIPLLAMDSKPAQLWRP